MIREGNSGTSPGSHSSPLDAVWGHHMGSGGNEFWHSKPQDGARCPFYGFAWPASSHRLIHVGGNRCGLALDRLDSCAMEEAGRDVNMQACPMADRFAHFIGSAASVIAFVTPDHPEGLPYGVWLHRTMVQCEIAAAPRESAA
jgi:hypothetical protein